MANLAGYMHLHWHTTESIPQRVFVKLTADARLILGKRAASFAVVESSANWQYFDNGTFRAACVRSDYHALLQRWGKGQFERTRWLNDTAAERVEYREWHKLFRARDVLARAVGIESPSLESDLAEARTLEAMLDILAQGVHRRILEMVADRHWDAQERDPWRAARADAAAMLVLTRLSEVEQDDLTTRLVEIDKPKYQYGLTPPVTIAALGPIVALPDLNHAVGFGLLHPSLRAEDRRAVVTRLGDPPLAECVARVMAWLIR